MISHANEFVVQLPGALKDKSVQIYSLAEEGPSDFGIVVARDRLRTGEDLDAFLDRQLAVLAKQMPLYRLLLREDAVLDKQPARRTDCVWHPPQGKMFQRQLAVIHRPTQQVLLVGATCKEAWASKWDPLWNEFLTNFRLRS